MMIPNQTIPVLSCMAYMFQNCHWLVLLETGILARSPSPTACVEAADIAQRELEEIDAAKLKAPEDQLSSLRKFYGHHFKRC